MAVSALEATGSCGTNVEYSFDSTTGELTISVKAGAVTGAMTNYTSSVSSRSPFWGKSEIKIITIESGVTSIGDFAFYNCSGLTSITIPASVTSIGKHAFEACGRLTSITIPEGVTSIGSCVFMSCSGLTSVIIGAGVTSIGYSAFEACSGLTSITIPASVTSIGDTVFLGCSGLTSIVVAPGNAKYDSRNNCNAIIEKSANILILGCKNTTIPDSVTSIDGYAFYNCSGLTNITISDGVISIGRSAFSGCNNLTIIGSGDTTKTAYTYAQSNSIDYATVWVKKDSSTHTRTFYGFRTNSSATAEIQTNNHSFVDDICSECGAISEFMITINVTTKVSRNFVIYILDSSNQPTRQFVANGTPIKFTVEKSSTFTVQVYETLYMSATIDGDKLLKKTYSNVANDTTIAIDISGVMNVNNWVMI